MGSNLSGVRFASFLLSCLISEIGKPHFVHIVELIIGGITVIDSSALK